MIGQENIVEKIQNQYVNNTLPRTMLFLGEDGCGKHTLANIVAKDILKIDLVDISENISLECLTEIQLCSLQKLYVIDGHQLDNKKQNVLLKFLEEPLSTAYIIILAESKLTLLPTLLNRCQVYQLNLYTNVQLKEITGVDNPSILKYCHTPGKILNFNNVDIDTYITYIDRMLTLLRKASWSNILKLSDSMYFTDKEFDKNRFSFTLVSNLLQDRAMELYVDRQIPFYEFQRVVSFMNDLRISNINKKQLFENFIFSLKGSLT